MQLQCAGCIITGVYYTVCLHVEHTQIMLLAQSAEFLHAKIRFNQQSPAAD